MNREILFKAKRIDNSEWAEGWLLKDEVTGQCFIHASGNSVNESDKVNEEGCLRFIAFEVDENTICQYTGLNDKNGKKIWENDIVNCYESECFGVIKWEEDEAKFIFDIVLEDLAFEPEDVYDYIDDMEVVGNIFDNPELLKGSEENG